MSDTPRTDAVSKNMDPIDDSGAAFDVVALARALERENARLRKALEVISETGGDDAYDCRLLAQEALK